jgi:hypothetical protein
MTFNKTSSALTILCKTGCQLLQVSKSLYKVRLELPLSGSILHNLNLRKAQGVELLQF